MKSSINHTATKYGVARIKSGPRIAPIAISFHRDLRGGGETTGP